MSSRKVCAGDSVVAIPGCGPRTAEKLNVVGVVTVKDLLEYRGASPEGPVNLSRLQATARSLVNATPPTPAPLVPAAGSPPHTKQHSWYGLVGHRLGSRVVRRVRIGMLMITPYGVVLATRDKGGTFPVSPLMLSCTHTLWKGTYVVSDDEGHEDGGEARLSSEVDLTVKFEVAESGWTLTDAQRDALKLVVAETQAYQSRSLYAIMHEGV